MILHIPVVTEANYPELKSLCHPNVVGKDHADFLRIIDQTIEHSKRLDIKTARVFIDPSTFSKWLGDRKAQRIDLLHYADMIHRNLPNHDEPKMHGAVPAEDSEGKKVRSNVAR